MGHLVGAQFIQLFKGVKNSTQLMNRESLLVCLKGSKTDKEKLKYNNPALFEYFQNIWTVCCQHMVKGLPSQYCFMLLCRYNNDCPHPVCKKDVPPSEYRWYSGGPSVNMLPLPVIDIERPWGSDCEVCNGKCCGHYKNVLINVCDSSSLDTIALPPSTTILKKEFNTTTYPFSGNFVQSAAKKATLSPSDTSIWLEHIHTVLMNRKCGATKAAATRRAKKVVGDSSASVLSYHCGKCSKEFKEETESPELWIGCDVCDAWYCGVCENILFPPESDLYVCSKCT